MRGASSCCLRPIALRMDRKSAPVIYTHIYA
jgi:hypothetical protein